METKDSGGHNDKILFVSCSDKMSGAEKVFLDYFETCSMSQKKCFDAIVPKGDFAVALKKANIGSVVETLEVFPQRHNIFKRFMVFKRNNDTIYNKVKKDKPIIILGNNLWEAVMCLKAQKLVDKRFVWCMHNIINNMSILYRLIYYLLRKNSETVIAVSRAVKEHLADSGFSAEMVSVVYNGINLEQWQRNDRAVKQIPHIDNNHIVLSFVGLLTEWKGVHIILDALDKHVDASLKERIILLIVGSAWEDHYEQRLTELVEQMGDIKDKIFFLGYRNDIPNILWQTDILIHASVRPDPLPTTVLQGVASGTFTIGANGGGVPEMLCNRELGEMFEMGSSGDLGRTLTRVITEGRYKKVPKGLGATIINGRFNPTVKKEKLNGILFRSL